MGMKQPLGDDTITIDIGELDSTVLAVFEVKDGRVELTATHLLSISRDCRELADELKRRARREAERVAMADEAKKAADGG